MEIVYSVEKFVTYLETAVQVDPERPVLIDLYLSDAIEIGVYALADSYENVVMGGIMEHIEQAGVHSIDLACFLPTKTFPSSRLDKIRTWTTKVATSLIVCGLINCQYAITPSGDLYLLEVIHAHHVLSHLCPRQLGIQAKYASLVMSGKPLYDLEFTKEVITRHVSVKKAVLPFEKSSKVVMYFLVQRCVAQVKSWGLIMSPLLHLLKLRLLLERSYLFLATIARACISLSFRIVSTSGTAQMLELEGLPVALVLKMHEGRPHAGDMVTNGQNPVNGHYKFR